MSAEARLQEQIADAVRREAQPLREAVEALSARLAAVEGDGGQSDAEPAKRPARGRGARAKTQPADDGSAGTSTESAPPGEKPADGVPAQRKGNGE
jgi:hypothetical protein